MSKSFVTMETKFCPICGKEKGTGAIFLDRHLNNKFDQNTCTGVALCQEHQAMVDSGEWVALIEAVPVVDHSKGTTMYDATGNGCLLKKEIAIQIFGQAVAPTSYIEVGVLERLQSMTVAE